MFCQKLDSILCSNFRLLSVVNHILNCIINIENTKARIHSVYEIKYGIMIQESSVQNFPSAAKQAGQNI